MTRQDDDRRPETGNDVPVAAAAGNAVAFDNTATDPGNRQAACDALADAVSPYHGLASDDFAVDLTLARPNRYRVTGEHGRGGLGRVVRAQDRNLGREVAIKQLLVPGHSSEQRFLQEALITARLEHPGIVPVYEAGRGDDGAPYYAMKLVAGRPLSEALQRARHLNERLALLPNLLAVAEAIAYAHARRVIHRDLKPSNVMVGEYGETVVIDWGLAKDLTAQHGDKEVVGGLIVAEVPGELTVAGQVVGTPAYMSPEQARGEPADERSDVYSLGAMLYQLIAREAPHRGDSVDDLLAKARAADVVPVKELEPEAPDDLVAIVEQAMAATAAQRYPTAREFAADLRRYQQGQLVGAQRYTMWQLWQRWLRKHRTLAFVVAGAAMLIVAIGAIAVWRVVQERDVARDQQAHAVASEAVARQATIESQQERNRLVLFQAESQLGQDPTAALAWLKQYPRDGAQWSRVPVLAASAVHAGVAQEVVQLHEGKVTAVAVSHDGTWVLSGGVDGAVWAWNRSTQQARLLAEPGGLAVVSIAVSPVEASAAVLWQRGAALFELSTGNRQPLPTNYIYAPRRSPIAGGRERIVTSEIDDSFEGRLAGAPDSAEAPRPRSSIRFSPDGRKLLADGYAGMLHLWDKDGGNHARVDALESRPIAASMDLQGRVAYQVGGGDVYLLDPAASSPLLVGDEPGAKVVGYWPTGSAARQRIVADAVPGGTALSPDGRWLATLSAVDRVRVFGLQGDATREFAVGGGGVRTLAFTADGTGLLVSTWAGAPMLWDVAAWQAVVTVPPAVSPSLVDSTHGMGLIQFADDLTVVGADGGVVKLWFLAEGEHRSLVGHRGVVTSVAVARDGSVVASAGEDGAVRVWLARAGEGQRLVPPNDSSSDTPVRTVAVGPAGRRIVAVAEQGKVGVWDRKGEGYERRAQTMLGSGCVAVSAAGVVAACGADGAVWLWAPESARAPLRVELPAAPVAVAFSPDGTIVTVLCSGGKPERDYLVVVAVTDGARVLEQPVRAADSSYENLNIRRHSDRDDLVFSGDGSQLAISLGATYADLRVWDTHTWEPRDLVLSTAGQRPRLAWSPDGQQFAATDEHEIELRGSDGSLLRRLSGHSDNVSQLAYSPDGRKLASVGLDRTLRLWDVTSGSGAIVAVDESSVDVRDYRSLEFSPDGRALLWDREWPMVTYLESGATFHLPGPDAPSGGSWSRFAGSSRRIVTRYSDGSVYLWEQRLPRANADSLPGLLEQHTRAIIDLDGRPSSPGTQLAPASSEP